MAIKSSARGSGTGCVAIDLGANAVRVVEMEWGSDVASARVVKRGTAALPANVWNDLPTHREAVAAAIQQALSGAGIAARSVVASLPRRLVTLRLVRLPHAPPDQMRGMVTFEAQQYILFSLDEVVLSYHVLPPKGVVMDDLDTVLLAAARRSLVAEVMAIFERAGLELQQLTVSALALAEHVRDSGEPTALLDLEPGELDVAVIADGQLLYTRASALDVGTGGADVAERRVAEEVARSITAYQNEFRNRPLARILLAGGEMAGLRADSLDATLSQLLETPVTPLQTRLIAAGDTDARAYATAMGAALQSRSDSIAPINLIPGERAEKRAAAVKAGRQRVGLLAAAALLIVGVIWAQNSLSQSAKQQQATLAANREMNAISDQVTARQKTFDKQNQIATELSKGLDRNHPAVDVLVALNGALPHSADIWLTQFTFDRNGLLTLRGQTKAALAATDMVIALQKSGAFNNVRLVYLGDAQDTDNGSDNPAPATSTPRRPAATASAPAASANGNGAAPPASAVPSGNAPPNGSVPPGLPPGVPAGGPPPGSGVPGGGVPPGGFPPPGGGFVPRSPPGNVPNAVPFGGRAFRSRSFGGRPLGSRQLSSSRFGRGGNPTASTPNPVVSAAPVNRAPVPSITLPPGTGTPRLPKPAPSANTTTAGTNAVRTGLTSFIITCRVNARRISLLPKNAPVAASVKNDATKKKVSSPAVKSTAPNATDNGDEDADTQ